MINARRALLLATDLGFVTYWVLTLGKLLPPDWLFRDYGEPAIMAWNLSFLPLDAVVSASGLASVGLERRCPASARVLLVVSLVTTSISGLQAIAFWALRHDFDLAWWAPNAFLMLWPLPFLAKLVWNGIGEGGHVKAARAQG